MFSSADRTLWTVPGRIRCAALCALCIIFMVASTSGFGAPVFQSLAETVQGSERTHIGDYVAWYGDCSPRPIRIEMIDPPKHGTLSQEEGPVTVKEATTGTIDGCSGREIAGILLFYQAEADFRGDDVFKFRYRYVEPDDEPVIVTFTVTVE